MFAAAKRHSMERIRAATVRTEPFAHIYVEEVFPPDFYAEMQARLLDDNSYRRLVDTGRVGKAYSPERWCFMPQDAAAAEGGDAANIAFWRELFATYCDGEFSKLFLGVFRDAILDRFVRGEAPQTLSDKMSFAPEIFLMRDRETYALRPHTDSPKKVVAALFYLPPDDASANLGTTFYAPKEKDRRDLGEKHLKRAEFDVIGAAPFRANTLFAFPKTATCFHGVEPIAGPCQRDIMLFDIKLAPPQA